MTNHIRCTGYLSFMLSLSDINQADVNDLLNIDSPHFEQMVGQVYSTELQLNEANSFDTEAPFFPWTDA